MARRCYQQQPGQKVLLTMQDVADCVAQRNAPAIQYSSDDASWPALLAHANAVSCAYARALSKVKRELAAKDRAIDFYKRLNADLDRQLREAAR